MRTLLFALVASVTAGCATTSSSTPVHVVDVHGRSVTTTARLDAEVSPEILHCGLDRYIVVPRENPFTLGAHIGTRVPLVREPAALCEQIRARR
ncbi:MAG: hypothetical protein JWP01_2482 [Myxococcales bacterium]|nr:hypothetical protein [Myxococcales bacterium]